MDRDNETALTVRANNLTVRGDNTVLRNKSIEVSAIRRSEDGAADYVPHISPGDMRLIVTVEAQQKQHGERNSLLEKLLYDGALRCSEGIGVRPCDISRDINGWVVSIMGKGSKPGKVAISASLAAEIQSYCYRHKIGEKERIFPISRSQCFRIVCNAFDRAGVRRPTRDKDRVGAVHILRHSGAIERLRQTGNPKAVQDQLRHKSAQMTLRYLKTISADESLQIQQKVDFKW
jgi:integrase